MWDMIDENGVRHLYADKSTRTDELSTRMICLSEGTRADCTWISERFGMRCSRRGILLRGSLRGRLDSALMIRWLVSRWPNAATTCMALKEGLSGTSIAPSLNNAYVA
jgi:hypothetical protein